MADRFDLDAIEADDALLDLLAAGGESAWAAGEHDSAVRLLAGLRLAVEVEDELPVETIDDPDGFLARCAALNPVTDPFARKMAARGVALGVAAVAALSVSGVAAAVTGDPLSPYEEVIKKVVDAVRPQTSSPLEQLDGLPVVDKTKIVKVAKDFQRKQEDRAAEDEKSDPLTDDLPAAQDTVPKPPLLARPMSPTELPPKVLVAPPVEPVAEKPPVDQTPVVEPTTEPTEPPATEPTPTTPPPVEPPPASEPVQEPAPTTPAPTTPAPTDTSSSDDGSTDAGADPAGEPTTAPSSGGENGSTDPDAGGDKSTDGESSQDDDTSAGGSEQTSPSDQGGGQTGGQAGDSKDEKASGDKPAEDQAAPEVVATAKAEPAEPTRLERYVGKGAKSNAKHSNGKHALGYAKAQYAKGKHSNGRYAEGRHAAIARAHGSMAPMTLRQILVVLNGPMGSR
jgi:hypothetical protein